MVPIKYDVVVGNNHCDIQEVQCVVHTSLNCKLQSGMERVENVKDILIFINRDCAHNVVNVSIKKWQIVR